MTRATGLTPRKAYQIDRESVLLGKVRASESEDAATRTGTARLLPFKLNTADLIKFVASGGTSSASGGYVIEVAHVPLGGTISDAGTYAAIGTIAFSGTAQMEVGFTGNQIDALVKAADNAITGDARVCAIKLTAGTGSNGVAAPAGTGNLIHVQNGGN